MVTLVFMIYLILRACALPTWAETITETLRQPRFCLRLRLTSD